MKRNKIFYSVLLTVLMLGSCKQEVVELQAPATPTPGPTPTPGSASFTKFIAIGNSYVAGVQAGALFTDGQKNSLPAIINTQLAQAGGNATFTQPTIGASLGYNLFVTPNPGSDNKVIGRLLLQYGTSTDCATGKASPKPTPQKYPLGNLEAVPNPALNPSFLYTGGKANLNNFGVPAIVLGQALITNTGNWALAGTDPRFNPFYGRLSYPGTGSTIIGDAAAAGSSFFMFYLGLDDFFLYAAFGGDPNKAPLTPATGAGVLGFDQQYAGAIGALMGSNANLKGVVGNFPDIFVMPHFTAVSYNPIPLDAATATAVNSGFAGYNAALDGLIANASLFGISAALKTELATRKVTYAAGCTNKILIIDETLTNIAPYFDAMKANGLITQAQRDALSPYVQVRQTTSTDIIPLSTGSVLGTLVGSDPTKVNGVTVPLGDQYCLIPTEIAAIRDARTAYNSIIANVASTYSTRLAVADVSAGMAALVAAQAGVYNNVTITPNINPPTGIYSEDGVHPNSRGYAFIANIFIGAINSKFGATVPLADLSKYSATALPIP